MQRGIIKKVEKISKEGKKTFYTVLLQDETKMSTFDSKIEGADAGDSLEFEVHVEGKYINLADGWKLTKKASSTAQTPTGQPGNGPDMTKEEWALKQRLERDSIETQTAVKVLITLYGVLLSGGIPIPPKAQESIDRAFSWCDKRLGAMAPTPAPQTPAEAKKPEPAKEAEKPVPTTPVQPPQAEGQPEPLPHLKTAGELLTRCKNNQITRANAFSILGITDIKQLADLDEAWTKIAKAKDIK